MVDTEKVKVPKRRMRRLFWNVSDVLQLVCLIPKAFPFVEHVYRMLGLH
jgi:hypothetical protein